MNASMEEAGVTYTGFQGPEATRIPFSIGALRDLYLAPQRFFRTVRLDGHPAWLGAAWICGVSAAMDKVDQQALKADLNSQSMSNPIGDSWLYYWLLVLFIGTAWAAFRWYVGGWWYTKRLEWSRVDEVDPRTAYLTYTWAGLVVALPAILAGIALTMLYPSYRVAWEEETWLSTAVTGFLFWSIFTSWRGANTVFGARGIRSYLWFLILPAVLYVAIFATVIAAFMNKD